MARDLLFEIGTEEIPARFMPGAVKLLAENAEKALLEARVSFGEIKTFGTPRRLVLSIQDLSEMQSDQTTRRKGPSVKVAFDATGAASKALEGFARSCGVAVADLVQEEGYMYAVLFEKGKPVAELLPQILLQLIEQMNFPKTMRWSDLDFRFVRPIHWLVALWGEEVIPLSIAGVHSGRVSKGHRILGSDAIEIACAADYWQSMQNNFVVVDPNQRRDMIRSQVEALALEQGGTATIDDELLEEVLYLVEYPTALCGRFEEKYLDLPVEAIITPMREHQRYFPVFDKKGRLLPVFITVRNGGSDSLDNVRHGNERVLRARLADARFFYDEDRKVSLADRVDKLKTIVFQEGLGTMYDKAIRLQKLSAFIAARLGIEEREIKSVNRAALLAKADLVTGMVCEFTELQGIMGREYALLSGEAPVVADAIFEHYLPRFAGDILPRTKAGRAVAIADKIDNIVTTFSRGLIPTGSQDPYALRRQALGVVNMLIDGEESLSLSEISIEAMRLAGIVEEGRQLRLQEQLEEFFRLRIKNVLSEAQIRYDLVDALLARNVDNVYQTWLWAQAMSSAEGMTALDGAVEAFTRAANLAGKATVASIEPNLLETDAEKELYQAYLSVVDSVAKKQAQKDLIGILASIAGLATPISKFFSSVMVMVEDEKIRDNRLALLLAISRLTEEIADFSRIVPVK